jgi:threonylcarbamoyladenosine tRNA methylthiotransferase MtaB
MMVAQKKVAFYTLGCKLNYSETSAIGRLFEDKGYQKVEFTDSPAVFVINTCSVTENADKKCRKVVKEALKISPEAFIVIIGCYAQLKPAEIATIPGVDLVLGASEKFQLLDYLNDLQKTPKAKVYNQPIAQATEFISSYSYGDRTRTFLKVQDGCDYTCTFCTIPLARGISRNAGITKTIAEAKKIAETSVNEIVLTGVNIGDFGQGSDENFLSLIKEMDKIEGIERFRISSIEPNLLSNEIIEFCLRDSKHFAPHFHIPLQSGSDRLLVLMRRKYLRALYTERVQKIKQLRPDACIGVDVIVGFPGETDDDFNDTLDYLKDLDISYLHVFTYSERANTTAIKIGEVVPMEVRRLRSKELHQLSNRKKRNFYMENIDTRRRVLFEQEEDDGYMYGFTENYIKVKVPFDQALTNTFQMVKLIAIDSEGIMLCEPIMQKIFSN